LVDVIGINLHFDTSFKDFDILFKFENAGRFPLSSELDDKPQTDIIPDKDLIFLSVSLPITFH